MLKPRDSFFNNIQFTSLLKGILHFCCNVFHLYYFLLIFSFSFHVFAYLIHLFFHLSSLSIRGLSILIIVVLNSQPNNFSIPAIPNSSFDAYLVSSNCILPFSIPCNFLLQPDLMYSVKGTLVNKPLVIWRLGLGESKHSLVQ